MNDYLGIDEPQTSDHKKVKDKKEDEEEKIEIQVSPNKATRATSKKPSSGSLLMDQSEKPYKSTLYSLKVSVYYILTDIALMAKTSLKN